MGLFKKAKEQEFKPSSEPVLPDKLRPRLDSCEMLSEPDETGWFIELKNAWSVPLHLVFSYTIVETPSPVECSGFRLSLLSEGFVNPGESGRLRLEVTDSEGKPWVGPTGIALGLSSSTGGGFQVTSSIAELMKHEGPKGFSYSDPGGLTVEELEEYLNWRAEKARK